MNSSFKRLVRLSAISAIGLAGSAVPAFATAPPAFACASGEWVGLVLLGRDDKFAPKKELTAPSAAFQAVPTLSLNVATNLYDQTLSNYHFGDTLPVINPLSFPTLTKARVTMRMKPNSGAGNDGLHFSSQGWPAQTSPVAAEGARVGFAINSLPAAAPWAPPRNVVFVFEFLPSAIGGFQVWGDTTGPTSPAASPAYGGANFFAALNANKRLDAFVQDDTSIDFVQLEICAKT
jgi:hypothetical protein